ncbi:MULTISPECIES: GPP34 family phosphoprotein [unclassified Streptomyces]|uniref:GPP34 family phosphoprotein n=1 Tax=unclassified Streptomyces TaxID=2593676 RepID=UPI0038230258
MSTAQDLLIVSLDVTPTRSLEQGELALALAGAELIDLLASGAVALDDERIVPGPVTAEPDALLAEAERALVRVEPFESVEDWLWRRGRGLSAAYTSRLEADGAVTRPRGRLLGTNPAPTVRSDSPAAVHAAERWSSSEPVLTALATEAGLREEPDGGYPDSLPDPVATVLAAVGEAVTELAAVQQRRSVEDAAFDNVWRGF